MKNTENYREGIMNKSKKFMKEHKNYKNHSEHLKNIQEAFEKNGYKFKTMDDVENIILLLQCECKDESFFDDNANSDDDSNKRERTPLPKNPHLSTF